MQSLRGQSFDLFGRYAHVWSVRQTGLAKGRLRILDVGDPFGTISALFPDDHTVSLDVYTDRPPVDEGHQHVVGSGFELPFADDSFDLVCSHDTLEHLPAERRTEFLAELLRVSQGPVVVVAPFADQRSERAEQIINSYFVARLGHTIPALDEHSEFGLPDGAALTAWLTSNDVEFRQFADGWLPAWVAFYLLKAHLLAQGAQGEVHRLDTAYNDLLTQVDHRAPHYRTTLVLRPPRELPELPDPVTDAAADVRSDIDDLSELALSLGAALVHGEDPVSGTRVRGWIDAHRNDQRTAFAGVAAAMEVALDALVAPPAQGAAVHVPGGPLPTVAVILVNLNGAEHLRPCLDSLAVQDYPRELTDVVVVDNGSTDGSLELLEREYPWVRVLPQGENTGFAPAVTTGVQSVEAECVAFVNNDMRVDVRWLSELVGAYDPGNGTMCVAGHIQSWDGERVDFVEGVMNFYGMGLQVGFGRPVGSVDTRDGQPLLFACGGSMLVSRHVYLTSGGFDPGFFAYFEDVDFGWRLWVLGYEIRFAERAVAYHRMHGTSSRFPEHQRMLLYERNALRALIKNYSDEQLGKVLAPAMMLLVKRAISRGNLGQSRPAYAIGGDREPNETVPRVALAHLHAVDDVLSDLDQLIDERHRIQRARRCDDAKILSLFGQPFTPVVEDPEYVEVQRKIVSGFGLDQVFSRHRAHRVLCVSSDEIGEKMRGPAIRAFEIARALSPTVGVAVAVPGDTDTTIDGIPTLGYADEGALVRLAQASDVVLIQGYTLRRFPALSGVPSVLVVDLYDPWLFENIELHGEGPGADMALRQDVSVLNELIDAGDYFICASERQRDYWLGMLSARSALDSSTYASDPTLRNLIDVVPFGLPSHRPRHLRPVLKGVHPAVAEDDLVVLWGGGTWDWFDPISVIEAWPIVVDRIPNAKLYFLGLQLASPDVAPMKMAEWAVRRAEQLGLAGTSVIFGDWAPYELREAFLLESDVAVSAAKDLAETRLAFRSRILDYLWAGLPVVTTSGDVLSDLVHEKELGIVVPPSDVGQLAHALVQLLADPGRRAACAARATHVAEDMSWARSVEPLRR
ncbi:MAG TPA: glycosyltransferase, partial [Acidimicrobiales bacterium]|nr:glycosyltransferase [Acidimicrobiales bacterium]